MSWFKGAMDKVKEKSAAVKGIAKDVAFKTKEVRSRLLGASTAAELQTQLEIRAGAIETCEYLHETLRFWISQLQFDINLKGYRYPDVDERSLSFTQVLLRSNCIEELFACIVCSPSLRAELLTAWSSLTTESPDTSPSSDRTHANSSISVPNLAASSLREFLSRTLTGDESIWFELVGIFLSPHGHDRTDVPSDTMEEDFKIREFTDSSADWVARCHRGGFRSVELNLLRSLKRDWFADWLDAERRDLALALDAKRAEMLQSDFWDKVRLSGELVGLYESIKDNLDTCSTHRVEENKVVLSTMESQAGKSEALKTGADSDSIKSVDRQSKITANAEETEREYQPRLLAVSEERSVIDARIENLQEQRRQLKLQLEAVSAALVAAQSDQRFNMTLEEQVREELSRNRLKFAKMLEDETFEESENKLDSLVNSQCLVSIQKCIARMKVIQEENSHELADIYTQFDNAFLEAVQDHITILCECIQDLYRRCKRVGDDLEAGRKSKTSQSMSQVLKGSNESVEFNASVERVNLRLIQLEAKLAEEAEHVAEFKKRLSVFFDRFEPKLNANRLLKGEVDKVNVVLSETDKIIKKYSKNDIVETPVVETTLMEEEIGEPQDASI